MSCATIPRNMSPYQLNFGRASKLFVGECAERQLTLVRLRWEQCLLSSALPQQSSHLGCKPSSDQNYAGCIRFTSSPGQIVVAPLPTPLPPKVSFWCMGPYGSDLIVFAATVAEVSLTTFMRRRKTLTQIRNRAVWIELIHINKQLHRNTITDLRVCIHTHIYIYT